MQQGVGGYGLNDWLIVMLQQDDVTTCLCIVEQTHGTGRTSYWEIVVSGAVNVVRSVAVGPVWPKKNYNDSSENGASRLRL